MTTRDTPFAPGTPCWVDLSTSDVDAAKAFYGGLFSWQAEDSGEEFGGYVTFLSNGHRVAGMIGGNDPATGRPDAWTTYLCTTDAAATAAAAEAARATVIFPPLQVREMGTMAVMIDPAGAAVGLWQPDQMTGFGKYNEPNSVSWDELHSKDFQGSLDFYGSLFGYSFEKMADTDEFRYYNAQLDGQTVAGVMDALEFLPPDVPSNWAVYFSVADVDATLATVAELGGTVIRPGEDTTFGRVADVADPGGAVFKLHGPVTGSQS